MRGLHDKSVLITGAAGAIGRATAQRFIEEGARVIAVDYAAPALAGLRRDLPGIASGFELDVTDQRAVREVFAQVQAEHGDLDILINNAGINARHEFLDIPLADWQRVMRTNVDGAFAVAQAAAQAMTEGGVILNTASTNGLVGYRRHAIYSSGKAALVELTKCMALDLAPRVRVNAVCPGYIRTPLMTAGDDQAADIPLGRFGDPAEVASLFAFLASADASYITGQALRRRRRRNRRGPAQHALIRIGLPKPTGAMRAID